MKSFLAATVIVLCLANGFYVGETRGQNEKENQKVQAIDIPDDEKAHFISLEGTPVEMKQIVQSGYDVNREFLCNTLLNTVIKSMAKGQMATTHPEYAIEKTKILLNAGADVNKGCCSGQTMLPLEWAVILPLQMIEMEHDVNKIVVNKIKQGTEYCDFGGIISKPCKDITPTEKEKITAVFHSAFKGAREELTPHFMEMIYLLVANGADINGKDFEEQTPLHRAALIPQGETLAPLKYLIEKGADINAQDINGNTPMFIAFAVGNKDSVKLLKDAGADTTIRNHADLLYHQVKGQRVRVFADGALPD